LDAWSAEQLAGRLDDSASTVDFATPGAVQTAVVELLVAALAAAGMSAYSVMEHLLRLELVLEHLVQSLAWNRGYFLSKKRRTYAKKIAPCEATETTSEERRFWAIFIPFWFLLLNFELFSKLPKVEKCCMHKTRCFKWFAKRSAHKIISSDYQNALWILERRMLYFRVAQIFLEHKLSNRIRVPNDTV
jgi:hypothetical protein